MNRTQENPETNLSRNFQPLPRNAHGAAPLEKPHGERLQPSSLSNGKPWRLALAWSLTAVLSFHAAYAWPPAAGLALLFLVALIKIGLTAQSWRQAFYPALAVGLGIAVWQLQFFWKIFSAGAAALWLVYAVWLGVFAVLVRASFRRLPAWVAALTLPFLWLGLEYFRSELYYLRFSWVTPALAFFAEPASAAIPQLGLYGAGFALAAVAGLIAIQKARLGFIFLALAMAWLSIGSRPVSRPPADSRRILEIAGVQMEFPSEQEVLARLTELAASRPQAELLVLSEYTFNEALPASVRDWCRKNRKHLLVGAIDPLPGGNYYNTAFVVGPDGEIVFRQVKAVPIQFFKDGLPAPEQRVWDSPWGRLGICICYDLSYTRVTDTLIQQGAEALIVPTMDVMDWGVAQHELHARVAPARAAEYGLPIFRLSSSGVSQAVDKHGRELARAGSPGEGAVLYQQMALAGPGAVPPDRWLAAVAVAWVGLLGCGLTAAALAEKLRRATLLSRLSRRYMTGRANL